MEEARGSGARPPWRLPRSVMAMALAFLVVGGLVALGLRLALDDEPHRVPVVVATAPVVAVSLAEEANALPGEPFAARAAIDEESARRAVAEGTAAAALVVDLAGTADVLVVSGALAPETADAVIERVTGLEDSYRRTVTVQAVPTTYADPATVDLFSLSTHVVGFVVILVISLLRGPVGRTSRRNRARHLVLAGIAAVTGLLLSVIAPGPGGPFLVVAALLALAVVLAGAVTLALEALAGLAGLGLAVLLFLAQVVPLLLRSDVAFLGQPWSGLVGATPVGALDRVLSAVLLHDQTAVPLWPMVVLVAWLAAALLVSAGASRRHAAAADPAATRGEWRWRVVAVVTPVVLLALGVVWLVPAGLGEEPEGPPLRAAETGCVETGPVKDLDDLDRITDRLRGGEEVQSNFQGGDVGASIELQDGRRIFVFGDTLRDPGFEGQALVRNSMLVVEPDCLRVVTPADHGALVPDRIDPGRGAPVGYWPMSLGRESRTGYDLVVVAMQRVRAQGQGTFDFEVLGPSAAVFVVPVGKVPQLVKVVDIGPDDPDPGRPMWGAASAIDDGWVYLYGTSHPDEEAFGYALQVARVRVDDVLDRSAWRFFDGTDWVVDEAEAVELIPAVKGVSQTLSVFEQDGTWFALSKRDDFLGTDLVAWTAPSPTGPFTPSEPLAQLPTDAATGEMRYMPLAHPGLLPEPGTMVVSYSRNRTDINEVIRDPMKYRPKFIRVELPE
ncbi:DUF4185 domain-containing protein [Nocardioides sp. AE5]|uniref:DUF4185 domain-containing protein n=1 Tax=Nocardioides sp. AE5 TaxID=2962573 RepID=UPI002881972A|nr:DUF4185 domain-containing protein [Nocardioides sp. AE5]MDT0202852.1 DUF4185 domain-containing protein [Nocardioides sp. AE5]